MKAKAKSKTKVPERRGGKLKPVPPPAPRLPLPVRVSPELIDRIDAVRDELIPREPYIRWLIELGLTQVEEDG